MLAALFLSGCAKGSGPATIAEPPTGFAPLTTEAPETTRAAIPETTTAVLETTTSATEPTTLPPETTTAPTEPATSPEPATTTPPETTPAPETPEFVRRRGGNGEPVTLIPLPEIPYERPDFEVLFADMDALAAQVKTESDVRTIVNEYKRIRENMTHVQTLSALAEFRYSQDVTDSYYSEEHHYLSAQSVLMNQKHNELLRTFADSPLRSRLEGAYFGRSYFEYNAKELKDETYLALTKREMELCNQYRALAAAPMVTYQGETKFLNEWTESESEEVQDGAYAAYIQAYHEPLGQLYLELVKVRQQLALYMGYENYLSYAFKGIYYRDYSPARAEEFFERVKTHLIPVLKDLYVQNPDLEQQMALPASLKEGALKHLATAAEAMGGTIWEAYRFMDAYDLCDVEATPSKREGGYTVYLSEYEIPFFFLNPASSIDIFGAAHEFGHFVDAYLNYGLSGTNEIAESISTAMEYLAIAYNASLNQEELAAGIRAVLIDKVLRYIGKECALADFEAQVYKKNPEELTLEDLDEMYYQCRLAYGLRDSYPENVQRKGWITMRHFFEYPEYVISYSVANIISLQILRLEENNPGAGLEALFRLIKRSPWAGVDVTVKNAKLQSPFASATLEQLAAFLREALELDNP